MHLNTTDVSLAVSWNVKVWQKAVFGTFKENNSEEEIFLKSM